MEHIFTFLFRKFFFVLMPALLLPSFATSSTIKANQIIQSFMQVTSKLEGLNILEQDKVYALVSDNGQKTGDFRGFRFPINDFKKEITLWADKSFLVEAFNNNEILIAIYSKNLKGNSFNLVEEKSKLSIFDAVPFYYQMFSNNEVLIRDVLHTYGISDDTAKLYKDGDSIFYQIGNETNFLMLRSGSFRLEKIASIVYLSGQKISYEIRFIDWDKKYPYVPISAEHYLKGVLIKKTFSEVIQTTNLKLLAQQKQLKYEK